MHIIDYYSESSKCYYKRSFLYYHTKIMSCITTIFTKEAQLDLRDLYFYHKDQPLLVMSNQFPVSLEMSDFL